MLRRGSNGVEQLDEGSNVRADDTSNLPPGYRLDLVGDPCVIALVREDGTMVARFTHNVDPEEVRLAAAEDRGLRGKGGPG
jgi:hypothetical protein